MERDDVRMLFQDRLHDFALDSDPSAVDDADLTETSLDSLV